MYMFSKFIEWFKKHFRRNSLAFMKWTISVFSAKIKDRVEDDRNLSEWKQSALVDFKLWMDDMPDASPSGKDGDMDACDLYTVLTEFSALRQEIRMQNREQNKSLQTLGSFIDAYEDAKALFKVKSEELIEFEEKIRQASEKRTVIPFLEMRDALVRGHKASQEVSKTKGFLRSAPRGIEGVIEGYEMAIRRFDNALAMVDIHPVETLGQPFDPKTMRAIEKRTVPGTEGGIVVEEQLSGFVREDEVIRTAEVVVSEEVKSEK